MPKPGFCMGLLYVMSSGSINIRKKLDETPKHQKKNWMKPIILSPLEKVSIATHQQGTFITNPPKHLNEVHQTITVHLNAAGIFTSFSWVLVELAKPISVESDILFIYTYIYICGSVSRNITHLINLLKSQSLETNERMWSFWEGCPNPIIESSMKVSGC